MGLFNFGKKKETSCGCNSAPAPEPMAKCDCGGMCPVSEIEAKKNAEKSKTSNVLVLGSGCKKCNDLEQATKEAMQNLGIDEQVGHVTDFAQIASYGVMNTPALVVDNKVVSTGKVLKTSEVEELLKKARA